jgi:hypothetical protein
MRKKIYTYVFIVFAACLLTSCAAWAGSTAFTIDVSDSVTAVGATWVYDNATKIFTVTGNVTITGSTVIDPDPTPPIVNGNRIMVAAGASVDITFKDAAIVVVNDDSCALEIKPGATVNLTVSGSSQNVLKSGKNHAGLQVPDGATLIITAASTSYLMATGGEYGAGVGGGMESDSGSITIEGGGVFAQGGYYGAVFATLCQ